MREIFVLIAVAGSAMTISSEATAFTETYTKIHEVEQRIERMKQNPSPIYEHYPSPE